SSSPTKSRGSTTARSTSRGTSRRASPSSERPTLPRLDNCYTRWPGAGLMPTIEVVRKDHLTPGAVTQGIRRDRAFEDEGVVMARSQIAVGTISAWHHHGTRHLYGFLVSGRLRFDYGRSGKEAVELAPGDFFHIPAGLVHRDVNTSPSEVAVVVNVSVGTGPAGVNVSETYPLPTCEAVLHRGRV